MLFVDGQFFFSLTSRGYDDDTLNRKDKYWKAFKWMEGLVVSLSVILFVA